MRVFRKKSTAVVAKQTPREKLKYVKKNWQLYVFFLLPGLLLTLIFKYGPNGRYPDRLLRITMLLKAFSKSWVGLDYFRRFLSSPDFMNYLMNTLKLSVFGLLWGFRSRSSLRFCSTRSAGRGSKEDSASDLCTELYLGHRTLWYGPYVPFSGGADQFIIRDRHQLDDNAGSIPDDLHRQRDLADRRVVLYHVYGGRCPTPARIWRKRRSWTERISCSRSVTYSFLRSKISS